MEAFISDFRNFAKNNGLFAPDQKILVGVSGGADSICLCHLLKKEDVSFGIAHVNFGLRDNESDEDEAFVERFASEIQVPFFQIRFNTEEFAQQNGTSIQMAARELRYQWFEKIRRQHHFHLIATAHHADDAMETFFINLAKGAGLHGLKGIPAKNGLVIRPLLFARREQIEAYIHQHNLPFRTDSSNLSDKYQRNFVRLHIIPLFREAFPAFDDTFARSLENLSEATEILDFCSEQFAKEAIEKREDGMAISIPRLFELPAPASFLFFWLKNYGFTRTVVKEIEQALRAQSGKVFFSQTHRIVKDRDFLLLSHLKPGDEKNISHLLFSEEGVFSFFHHEFKTLLTENNDFVVSKDANVAQLDFNKLQFPIVIRRWMPGDRFKPLGMSGYKKVSDFLTDLKLSIPQKEQTLVMCCNEEIVWVVGLRIHNDFKITEKTGKIFEIKILRTF